MKLLWVTSLICFRKCLKIFTKQSPKSIQNKDSAWLTWLLISTKWTWTFILYPWLWLDQARVCFLLWELAIISSKRLGDLGITEGHRIITIPFHCLFLFQYLSELWYWIRKTRTYQSRQVNADSCVFYFICRPVSFLNLYDKRTLKSALLPRHRNTCISLSLSPLNQKSQAPGNAGRRYADPFWVIRSHGAQGWCWNFQKHLESVHRNQSNKKKPQGEVRGSYRSPSEPALTHQLVPSLLFQSTDVPPPPARHLQNCWAFCSLLGGLTPPDTLPVRLQRPWSCVPLKCLICLYLSLLVAMKWFNCSYTWNEHCQQ